MSRHPFPDRLGYLVVCFAPAPAQHSYETTTKHPSASHVALVVFCFSTLSHTAQNSHQCHSTRRHLNWDRLGRASDATPLKHPPLRHHSGPNHRYRFGAGNRMAKTHDKHCESHVFCPAVSAQDRHPVWSPRAAILAVPSGVVFGIAWLRSPRIIGSPLKHIRNLPGLRLMYHGTNTDKCSDFHGVKFQSMSI